MQPLTPAVFHILLALADGEQHGYAIMREVTAASGGPMGPGTLYGTLKRMLDAKMIEECGEREDAELNDERRRYYRLTAGGRQSARDEAARLELLVRAARSKSLLRPKSLRMLAGTRFRGGNHTPRIYTPQAGLPA